MNDLKDSISDEHPETSEPSRSERERKKRGKQALHEQIVAFAGAAAGTKLDLDPDLEQASLDHLALESE